MKRRSFLATVAGTASLGVSGCVGQTVAQEINDYVYIEPNSGKVWEIDAVGGDAEIGYSVRSETRNPFQVFYFTNNADVTKYQTFIHEGDSEGQPQGHDKLSMTAIPEEEGGVYEAKYPQSGGRTEIEIEEEHYFVVDYSDYGRTLDIPDHEDDLSATVNLEVVEGGLF